MTDIQVTEIENFVELFRTAIFPEQFERLKINYQNAKRQSRQISPRYNIFHVLGVGYREVKTHSAFLADLLNPYGTHDHDFLFLNAFLKHCQSNLTLANTIESRVYHSGKFPPLPDNIEAYKWQINKEKVTKAYGRLDIVIQCKELNFLCVIENKVGADESEQQLKTYWDWMQTPKIQCSKQALLFLTPTGRKSSSAGNAPYFTFSYDEDIYRWLSSALEEVESPLVTAVIQQYLHLIPSLKA